MMMMSETHNGHRSMWQQVSTEGGGRGEETEGHPRIIRIAGKARPFTPGQTELPIILCLGKTTLSQDQIPAIHGSGQLLACQQEKRGETITKKDETNYI